MKKSIKIKARLFMTRASKILRIRQENAELDNSKIERIKERAK
jgi:hypothetical protein